MDAADWKVIVAPQEGQFVVFMSYLYHLNLLKIKHSRNHSLRIPTPKQPPNPPISPQNGNDEYLLKTYLAHGFRIEHTAQKLSDNTTRDAFANTEN